MKRITIATSCATALGLITSTAAIAQNDVDVLSTWSYDGRGYMDAPRYDMQYGAEEIETIESFDYGQMHFGVVE